MLLSSLPNSSPWALGLKLWPKVQLGVMCCWLIGVCVTMSACFALGGALVFGDRMLICAAEYLIIDLVGQLCKMSNVVELGLQSVVGLIILDNLPDVPMLAFVADNVGC